MDLKLVCLCLMEAAVLCTENKTICKVLKEKSDTSIPSSFMFNNKSRVQKAAYTVEVEEGT